MSIHNYVRALSGNRWDIDLKMLSTEVKTALPNEPFSAKAADTSVSLSFSSALSGAQLATLGVVISDHKASGRLLQLAKDQKIADVDKKTEDQISSGFAYGGKQFSCSLAAQSKMTAAHQLKDHASFVYPVNWNTLDDNDVFTIVDASAMDAFYLTAIGTIRMHLDSGTSLKDSVRSAIDVASVNAIVDNR